MCLKPKLEVCALRSDRHLLYISALLGLLWGLKHTLKKGWIIEVDNQEGVNYNNIGRYHFITRKLWQVIKLSTQGLPIEYLAYSIIGSKGWSYWWPGSSLMITLKITRVLPLDTIKMITQKSSLVRTYFNIGFSVYFLNMIFTSRYLTPRSRSCNAISWGKI